MNKLLIGLLIAAAGTGAFFLLRKKTTTVKTIQINKEWMVGKWKTDAVIPGDSSFRLYRYDFLKDGNILRSLNDSAKADTLHYSWKKNNELVWTSATDSAGKVFTVTKLTVDSLQVQTKDSTSILFTKLAK